MSTQTVPLVLYREMLKAAENIYRYDRMERFSIRQALEAGRKGQPVDDIVIKTAETALKNHQMEYQTKAA